MNQNKHVAQRERMPTSKRHPPIVSRCVFWPCQLSTWIEIGNRAINQSQSHSNKLSNTPHIKQDHWLMVMCLSFKAMFNISCLMIRHGIQLRGQANGQLQGREITIQPGSNVKCMAWWTVWTRSGHLIRDSAGVWHDYEKDRGGVIQRDVGILLLSISPTEK